MLEIRSVNIEIKSQGSNENHSLLVLGNHAKCFCGQYRCRTLFKTREMIKKNISCRIFFSTAYVHKISSCVLLIRLRDTFSYDTMFSLNFIDGC